MIESTLASNDASRSVNRDRLVFPADLIPIVVKLDGFKAAFCDLSPFPARHAVGLAFLLGLREILCSAVSVTLFIHRLSSKRCL
jgi:fatty-acid desaturase